MAQLAAVASTARVLAAVAATAWAVVAMARRALHPLHFFHSNTAVRAASDCWSVFRGALESTDTTVAKIMVIARVVVVALAAAWSTPVFQDGGTTTLQVGQALRRDRSGSRWAAMSGAGWRPGRVFVSLACRPHRRHVARVGGGDRREAAVTLAPPTAARSAVAPEVHKRCVLGACFCLFF